MKRCPLLLCSVFIPVFILACDGATEGDEGGPCFENETCNGDLVCASDLCVAVDATEPEGSPSAEPAAEPAASPAAEPAASPAAEPAASPAAEPAASPSAEPESEPEAPPPTCGATDVFASCESSIDIYVCENGEEGVFSCNTFCQNEGMESGTCVTVSSSDADCDCVAPEFSHGALCDANANGACGFPGTGLICVVENQGDSQGVCRRACTTGAECLQDTAAFDAFDTSCCDINNGSRVCANFSTYPEACGI